MTAPAFRPVSGRLIILALALALCGPAWSQTRSWKLLAGEAGTFGSADGNATTARFKQPWGMAINSTTGDLYVADMGNHVIRKVSPSGDVSVFAGSPGQRGSADGTGTAARFYLPVGVAVDVYGNVFVSDQYNHTIRKISPQGEVTTVAGTAGQSGSADGNGSAARFNYPCGLAYDSSNGNLYIADYANYTIRQLDTNGAVTTIAGAALTSGSTDGPALSARFWQPLALSLDRSRNLYITDRANSAVRKMNLVGTPTVSTFFSTAPYSPNWVAAEPGGTVYVSDDSRQVVYRVQPSGHADVVLGEEGNGTTVEGTDPNARFAGPAGLALTENGTLYVGSVGQHCLFIGTPQPFTTLAADFYGPNDVALSRKSFTATGVALDFTLNFAPTAGTVLRVFEPPYNGQLTGTLTGFAADSLVDRIYNGVGYRFRTTYFGPPDYVGIDLALTGISTSQKLSQPMASDLPATVEFGVGKTFALPVRTVSATPVTFAVTGPATVAGGRLAPTDVGSVQVVASQAADAIYLSSNLTATVKIVDTTAPKITNAKGGGLVSGTQAKLTATFSDNHRVASYTTVVKGPDGRKTTKTTRMKTATGLAKPVTIPVPLKATGVYSVQLTATDESGNVSRPSALKVIKQ